MTIAIISLAIAILSLVFGLYCFIYAKKNIAKIKNANKELATTMIMNFEDYEKIFKEHETTQKDIKRDNQIIINEVKRIQDILKTLNNGFSIPSFHNT